MGAETATTAAGRGLAGGLLPVVLAAALLAGACHGGGSADKFTIGFSQANKAEPWRTWMDDSLMKEAAKHARLVVLAVPSSVCRSVARELGDHVDGGHYVVHGVRGLVPGESGDPDDLRTISEVLREETPVRRTGALGGPALAQDILAVRPSVVVVGSRYVPGGGTQNWGLGRKLLSRGGSLYARTILGVDVRDLTAGFMCWRSTALEAIDLATITSNGYSFQIEMKYRALKKNLRVVETPIVFVDRRVGQSKMSRAIVIEALLKVWALRFGRR